LNYTRNIQNIQAILNNVSDPEGGMLAGVNCKPMSEQGYYIKDAVCIRTFNSLYALLIVTTISSWCLLVATCLLKYVLNNHLHV
jgi:hypothetical protein